MGRGTMQFTRLWSAVVLTLVLSAAFSTPGAREEKPLSLFEEANRFYEQGNYPEAIRRYETLLQHGASSEVFFNLGNARFRNGDTGLAIASYLHARKLAPRDADVLANLRFARQTVPGTVSVGSSLPSQVLNYFTLDEVAILMALALWVWLGLLALKQWQPQWRGSLRSATIISGVILLFSVVWLALAASVQSRRIAIVTVEQASARFGPLEESQIAFTANDGAELRVTDLRPDWVQVQDRSGRSAWVHERELTLFP